MTGVCTPWKRHCRQRASTAQPGSSYAARTHEYHHLLRSDECAPEQGTGNKGRAYGIRRLCARPTPCSHDQRRRHGLCDGNWCHRGTGRRGGIACHTCPRTRHRRRCAAGGTSVWPARRKVPCHGIEFPTKRASPVPHATTVPVAATNQAAGTVAFCSHWGTRGQFGKRNTSRSNPLVELEELLRDF